MKKTIEIANQPRLSLPRTIRITIDGIRYRLFRCAVTVAVIAVAVAFLMNIMSESLIKRAIANDTRERIARSRLVHDWMARLSAPGNLETLIGELASAVPGDAVYTETAEMAKLDEQPMAEFYAQVKQASIYLTWFNELDYARRRSLIHTAVGVDIFHRLGTPEGLKQFAENLKNFRSIHFATSHDDLQAFLGNWLQTEKTAKALQAGRKQAIKIIDADRAGRPIMECLAEEGFDQKVRDAGFHFEADSVAPEVRAQASRLLDIARLEKTMEHRPTRQAIAQDFNVLPADVNVMMMWKYLRNRKKAAHYLEKMQESEIDVSGLDAARLFMLADTRQEEKALIRAELLTAGSGGGFLGMGERMTWLLLVSMLVCGIGISNAMLMTVTERIPEIATLKCLGALDGFIMIMFVLESSFLGVVGGAFGAVLGNLIGSARMIVAFGLRFIGSVPMLDLVVGMVVAVALGVLLAAFAAVGPAFKAARLAPMEAMRIE